MAAFLMPEPPVFAVDEVRYEPDDNEPAERIFICHGMKFLQESVVRIRTRNGWNI